MLAHVVQSRCSLAEDFQSAKGALLAQLESQLNVPSEARHEQQKVFNEDSSFIEVYSA